MIEMIIKYYREMTLGIVVVCSLYVMWDQDNQIQELHNELVQCQADNVMCQAKVKEKTDQIATQNVLIAANKAEYDEAMARLPMKIETIKTKYVAVYNGIDQWKGEANATDCNGAMDQLNTFTF